MKLGMINKLAIVCDKCVLNSLHRNSSRLAIVTRKTTIEIENLNGEGVVRAQVASLKKSISRFDNA